MALPGQAVSSQTPGLQLVHCPASNAAGGLGCRLNKEAAQAWLYPASPPPREYQFSIAWTACQHNTLACLPTGLGKTLIAAVVMYNFYRWFPTGKVVFITPTRPLVEQQFQACKAFMGIHKDDVVKLHGNGSDRMDDWNNHRMFFTTPQCLQNDLRKGTCPAHKLVCLVVDECHRATGDAAMAKSVQLLRERRAVFRVLGLSATPGNSHEKIKAVVQNLMINRIEFRDDADADVAKHCHVRSREQRLVPVCQEGRLIRQLLRKLMTPLAMRLNTDAEAGFMFHADELLTPFMVQDARSKAAGRAGLAKAAFPSSGGRGGGRGRGGSSSLVPSWGGRGAGGRGGSSSGAAWGLGGDVNLLWEGLLLLAAAAEAYEQLGSKGGLDVLRSAEATGRRAVSQLLRSQASQADYADLLRRLEATAAVPHPKLAVLGQLLQEHFDQPAAAAAAAEGADGGPGRAIVFCTYLKEVAMVQQYLRQYEPMIQARAFIGQGNASSRSTTKKGGKKGSEAAAAAGSGGGAAAAAAAAAGLAELGELAGGMKQKEQQRVLQEYRDGCFNVLLATCIGEEGLDIPQVDLIICWDASSPSRMRQREGRTGRSRPGRVVTLLSEGREAQHYEDNHAKEQLVKGLGFGFGHLGRVVTLLSEGRQAQHYEDNHAKEQLVKGLGFGVGKLGRVVTLLSEGREAQHYKDNHAKEQLVKVGFAVMICNVRVWLRVWGVVLATQGSVVTLLSEGREAQHYEDNHAKEQLVKGRGAQHYEFNHAKEQLVKVGSELVRVNEFWVVIRDWGI
ncbi:hypothetical protein OEZ85_003496 [Tetradesmus obliquus]|uniref:P-loop containing nucleoside triphosphate hydrolase protein n=1 Tax=Tetradesmus obliquus TaxID=3088 RepID=A0ABY8UCA0_TETOB|nr:hypothetical protein OEZ85_003496 [Tetradesmus obliquus]